MYWNISNIKWAIAIIAIIGIIGIIARADQLDAEFRAATGLAEKTEESVSALLRNIWLISNQYLTNLRNIWQIFEQYEEYFTNIWPTWGIFDQFWIFSRSAIFRRRCSTWRTSWTSPWRSWPRYIYFLYAYIVYMIYRLTQTATKLDEKLKAYALAEGEIQALKRKISLLEDELERLNMPRYFEQI